MRKCKETHELTWGYKAKLKKRTEGMPRQSEAMKDVLI